MCMADDNNPPPRPDLQQHAVGLTGPAAHAAGSPLHSCPPSDGPTASSKPHPSPGPCRLVLAASASMQVPECTGGSSWMPPPPAPTCGLGGRGDLTGLAGGSFRGEVRPRRSAEILARTAALA